MDLIESKQGKFQPTGLTISYKELGTITLDELAHAVWEDIQTLKDLYTSAMSGPSRSRSTSPISSETRSSSADRAAATSISCAPATTAPPAWTTSCRGLRRTGKEGEELEQPCYIGLEQARQVLADMGVALTPRQMKRAADKDAHGRRKLPFFVDPIEGRLKIEKGSLVRIYRELQIEAEKNIKGHTS